MATNKTSFKLIGLISIFILLISAAFPFLAFAKSSEKQSNFGPQISTEDQAIIDLGYIPDEVIVKFKKSKFNLGQQKNNNKLNSFISKHENLVASQVRQLNFANSATLKLKANNVREAAEALKKDPDVETAIPNYVFEFYSGTDDPYYEDGSLWALNNTTNGKDIQADEAWDIATGGTTKIVALLDTGVSYDHPDLSANMWDGSDCVDENGDELDDCIHGYDFVNGDKDPADDFGHGTAMAGIIGAVGNNDEGVTGVNQTASIMAVKVGNSYGAFDDIISGIQFAQENGADIINASFGGQNVEWDDYSGMQDAIEDFVENGLFIAAAGNEWNDNDETGIFPSGFTFNNIISVAATDNNDDFAEDEGSWGSNWGEESVDLFAPGVGIWSTGIQNRTSITIDPDTEITKNSPWNESGSLLFTNTGTYSADTDASAITDEIDLSGSIDEDSAAISFKVWCDTESEGVKGSPPDYVQVSVRKDAGAWSTPLDSATQDESKINEELLKIPNVYSSYLGAINTFGAIIPSAYLDDTTQFKFDWHTDNNDVSGPYRGCYLEDITVSYLADGETGTSSTSYLSGSGTSASAAYTSGVAALIWNKYTNLTADEVRQIILDSGDDVDNEHPTTSEQLTVTGKRLNAYKALVMAEQVDSGQDMILYPTIHSKAGGGSWNSSSTWEEGRAPNSSDVVEINGTVTLSSNTTVAGALVTSGATLQLASTANITFTVDGDLVNNGAISSPPNSFYLVINGDLENNGTINTFNINISGDVVNTGTLATVYITNYIKGDLTNTGTITAPLRFNGTSTQTVSSTAALDDVTLYNDVTVSGNLSMDNLSVNSGKTLTISSDNTVNVSGTFSCAGNISGGNVTLNGSNQSFNAAGTMDVAAFTLGGTGIKSLSANSTVTGNTEIVSGVTLQLASTANITFTVDGDLVNNGAISSPPNSFYLVINGDLENNGTINTFNINISGDVVNTGTLATVYITNYIKGDLTNTGTITAPLRFNGTSTQTVSSTSALDDVTLYNDVTVSGNLSMDNLSVNSGKTLTIGGADTLTVNGDLSNSGTITGNNLTLGGGAQTWGGTGEYDLDAFIMGGTDAKSMNSSVTVSGDVTVNSGVTLQLSGSWLILRVGGSLVNNDTIQSTMNLYIGTDLDNNGTMNNWRTYADWEPVGGADSYEFQYTDTSDTWQTEVSTGTATHYNISAWENDDRRWRWRSVEDSTPSAWSSDKYIN